MAYNLSNSLMVTIPIDQFGCIKSLIFDHILLWEYFIYFFISAQVVLLLIILLLSY